MVPLRRCEFHSNWGFLEDERETNDEVFFGEGISSYDVLEN